MSILFLLFSLDLSFCIMISAVKGKKNFKFSKPKKNVKKIKISKKVTAFFFDILIPPIHRRSEKMAISRR